MLADCGETSWKHPNRVPFPSLRITTTEFLTISATICSQRSIQMLDRIKPTQGLPHIAAIEQTHPRLKVNKSCLPAEPRLRMQPLANGNNLSGRPF